MSRAADGMIKFGEWLPDLPANDNPGLSYALNVVPKNGVYAAYRPMSGIGTALSERPRGAIAVRDTAGNAFFYVGSATKLSVRNGTSWTDKSGAAYTTASESYWRFVQFDELVIATNYEDVPQAIDAGDAGNFADLALTGTAPRARQIGKIGRHVFLGDTFDGTNGAVPYRVQWPRIDDPTEWPVPNSSDAAAKQAGEQFLNSAFGAVTGIFGNDQFGVIFQQSGITRATYVGGNLVYQFDEIEDSRGCPYPNAIVTDGKLCYFPSADGFYVTDGVSVTPIGYAKFDQFFSQAMDNSYKYRAYGALEKESSLIYWSYPGVGSSAGTPNSLIAYNVRENRASPAADAMEVLVSGLTSGYTLDQLDSLFGSLDEVMPSLDSDFWKGGNEIVVGFDSSYKLGTLSGEPGTAILDVQEAELNPGLMTHIEGVKAVVDSSDLTVALGTRGNLSDAVTYSSDVAPTARTGFSDFRSESRYIRARVKIGGDFSAAQGVLYQSQPAGAA